MGVQNGNVGHKWAEFISAEAIIYKWILINDSEKLAKFRIN